MFENHLMQDLINKAEGNGKTFILKKTPIAVSGRSFYEYKGHKYTAKELAKISGIRPGTIKARIASGWSVAKAVTTLPQPRKPQKKLHV